MALWSFVTGVSESSRGWATTDPVAEKRADTILNLMLFIELFTLNRLWNGLTDEEMHWEPHAGAWGVSPASRMGPRRHRWARGNG